MTTFTTEDRENASPPHIVDSGASVMNNEPVAWINREEGSGSILDWDKDPYSEINIPLYTHPAKTLTDELKEALSVKVILNEHAQQSMKEVKDLIRKAQEK